MNKTAFQKLINSIVIRKYQWIVDFNVQLYFDAPLEKYEVYYYIDPNLDGSPDITEKWDEVKKLTKNIFDTLGPNRYQSLGEILFLVKYAGSY